MPTMISKPFRFATMDSQDQRVQIYAEKAGEMRIVEDGANECVHVYSAEGSPLATLKLDNSGTVDVRFAEAAVARGEETVVGGFAAADVFKGGRAGLRFASRTQETDTASPLTRPRITRQG